MTDTTRRTVLRGIAATALAGVGAGTAAAAPAEAAVSFPDQTRGRGADGARVRVAEATLNDGGFVVIHNDLLFEAAKRAKSGNLEGAFDAVVNSVSGVSDYLSPGTSKNVIIELTPADVENGEQTLVAMAHRDTNGNEAYDFGTARTDKGKPTLDKPYWNDPDNPGPGFVGGSGAVVDPATVRLVGGNGR